MKNILTHITIILSLVIGATACSSSDWDELPAPIATFVNEYFPAQEVSQYRQDGDTYHVKLHNSVALTFDARYSWTSVNGYGNTLPQMFLFDQMPPALYAYLQELSLTDQVYSVKRDSFTYNVSLLDSSVTYTIDTGIVTPDNTPSTSAIAQLRM